MKNHLKLSKSINIYFGSSNKDNYKYIVELAEREYDSNISRAINAIISRHRNGSSPIEQRLEQILFVVKNLKVVGAGKAECAKEEVATGIGGEFFK